jgi:peptidoglycan/LPS O-acetylase OafA/YrhL
MTYLHQLDGLRAVAMLTVLLIHYLPGDGQEVPLGVFGVNLFFCLSGYLITAKFLRVRDQSRAARLAITQYYWTRWTRLTIPFYLCVLGGVILNIPTVRDDWLWHVLYASNFWVASWETWIAYGKHFWYLAVDFQIFLLWP